MDLGFHIGCDIVAPNMIIRVLNPTFLIFFTHSLTLSLSPSHKVSLSQPAPAAVLPRSAAAGPSWYVPISLSISHRPSLTVSLCLSLSASPRRRPSPLRRCRPSLVRPPLFLSLSVSPAISHSVSLSQPAPPPPGPAPRPAAWISLPAALS